MKQLDAYTGGKRSWWVRSALNMSGNVIASLPSEAA
jgi:hypothetical protein